MDANMRKAILLLAANRPDQEIFRNRILGLTASQKLSGTAKLRSSLLLRPGEMPIVPHQEVMSDSPAPYDAIVELVCDGRSQQAQSDAQSVLGTLLTVTDAGKSTALICDEYCITSGYGPIFVGMALRRLRGLDHAAFMETWFGRHASLGQSVEGVRYRQDHVLAEETAQLMSKLGLQGASLDGLTLSYFNSRNEAVELLSKKEIRENAIADERTFIDHSKSQFGLYQVVFNAIS
jgi:hypothetical protein